MKQGFVRFFLTLCGKSGIIVSKDENRELSVKCRKSSCSHAVEPTKAI